jgi:polysaccharide biosynthesis/export protein
MKTPTLLILITVLLAVSCTSQKKLAYLGNLPEPDGKETFRTVLPDYKLQPRDIIYVTAKVLTTEGKIEDLFQSGSGGMTNQSGGEGGGYLYGYDVTSAGYIKMPVIGQVKVAGLTLEETKKAIQESVDKAFKNTTVECKLLSFKYTVIGEVKSPGAFYNYNSFMTVLEAIGRAGGIGDMGKRDRVLVVRSTEKGTQTYRLNLQDKEILNSEAYFLQPNDVIIVEQQPQKVFYQNLTTIGFIISSFTSTLTTTLLLINYLK